MAVTSAEAEDSRAKDSVIEPSAQAFSNNENGSLSSCSVKGSLTTGNSQRTQCYRTKLCKFFEQGLCDRGDGCTYAHSEEQLRQAPNLRKTKLCNQWQHNKCPHQSAATCPYAHGPSDLRCEIDLTSSPQPSTSTTSSTTTTTSTTTSPQQNETLTLSPSLTNSSTSASTSDTTQHNIPPSPSLRSLSSSISSTLPWAAMSKTNSHSQDIGNISKSCLAAPYNNQDPYYLYSSGSEKNVVDNNKEPNELLLPPPPSSPPPPLFSSSQRREEDFHHHYHYHNNNNNNHHNNNNRSDEQQKFMTEDLYSPGGQDFFFNCEGRRAQRIISHGPVLNQSNTASANFYESYSQADLSNHLHKTIPSRELLLSSHDKTTTQNFLDQPNNAIMKKIDEVKQPQQDNYQSIPIPNSVQEMAGASPFYLNTDWDFITIMSASSYRLTITAQFIHPYDD